MFSSLLDVNNEKRIYIRMEFRQSIGMNFVSPFQPKKEFKVYKSCKLYAVEYINAVCSLDYPFHFNFKFFKAVKKTL